jgi:D-3-phosphoglycerate dehydrogenase
MRRCALLDDYQNVALEMADWTSLRAEVDIDVFTRPLGGEKEVAAALAPYDIVCAMRERTPFPRTLFAALPNLKLLVTSGMRNAAIDLAGAREHGVTVCGTEALAHPTVELAFALILELARKVGDENARLKAGAPWQSTVGTDLYGKTLGVIGLGRLGTRVARIGRAFGMDVVAWSPNLTPERAFEGGAVFVGKEDLFRRSDVVTIHVVLGERTRGLVGAADLALMKPTAFLVNTSRGPIVDTPALIDALAARRIAGAGLDVYDVEPLPLDSPLRRLDTVVLSPHLGYVTADSYRVFYGGMVEAIRAFVAGAPVRVIT